MGYTHYWSIARDLTDDEFAAVGDDVRAIVAEAPCPIAGWDGSGEPSYGPDEIALNGEAPDDYETFGLSRFAGWTFCKTRGDLPYDVVVTASLLAAKDRLGDVIRLSSDGNPEDWEAGRELAERACQRLMPRFIQEDTRQ